MDSDETIIQRFKGLIEEYPNIYINKQFVCSELNYGDGEWRVIYNYLSRVWDSFAGSIQILKKTGRLKGSDVEQYNQALKMFKDMYGIYPYRYSGKRIGHEGGQFCRAGYFTPTFSENENRDNIILKKDLRCVVTKLTCMSDLGERVLLSDQEKGEFIEVVNRVIIGKVSGGNGNGMRDKDNDDSGNGGSGVQLIDNNADRLIDNNADRLIGNNADRLIGNNVDQLIGNNTDRLIRLVDNEKKLIEEDKNTIFYEDLYKAVYRRIVDQRRKITGQKGKICTYIDIIIAKANELGFDVNGKEKEFLTGMSIYFATMGIKVNIRDGYVSFIEQYSGQDHMFA